MQPTGSRAAQLAACGVLLLLVVGMLRSPAANAAITECDRLASHPADPDKVLPGFERKDIDLPRAEAACRAAIAEEPRSARALYQLGRVLYYQKKTADALPFLERSAALGYRQAIFVLGFVFYEGSQAPHDDCRTAELWQRSMALEHPWTGFYLVDGYLDGRFASCGLKISDAQLARYAEIATTRIPFAASEGRLEKLTARLEARAQAARGAAGAAAAAPAAPIAKFDPSKYSQAVTECDRLASHPEDPNRVAPGRHQPEIDLPKAIEACRAAVAADPKNPRLNYLLGRVLGYSGRGAEGIANRQVAVDADYPQALFVIGYITVFGLNQQPKDVCKGAELIRRSAYQGRLAGQFGFPAYVVRGLFDACPVRKDKQEMLGFIAAARKQIGGDYYQGLLADQLEREIGARP